MRQLLKFLTPLQHEKQLVKIINQDIEFGTQQLIELNANADGLQTQR